MSDLASPDDPLILRDGRKIDTTTGRVVKQRTQVVLPASSDRVGDIHGNSARRRIADTGVEPAALSSILAVASFRICNFDPIDICEALGTNIDMLNAVEKHSEYDKVMQMLIDAMRERAQNDARGVLAVAAPRAASLLADNIDADDPILAQEAAKGVLDRVGIGKSGEQGNFGGNVFRIEITEKRDETATGITIKVGV